MPRKTAKTNDASRPLSPMQARFVVEYPIDLNGSAAAERAGCSPRSAAVTAAKWLRKANVRAAIDAELAARAKRVRITADDVLAELGRLAFVDIAKAYDKDTGALLPIHEIPEDVRRAIAGVDVVELPDGAGTVRKLKLYDKKGSLELLGKNLKLFTDRLEVKVDESFAELLKRRRERAQRR